jgi:hypothetical protein
MRTPPPGRPVGVIDGTPRPEITWPADSSSTGLSQRPCVVTDVSWERNWHWSSGAAVALVAAGTGATAHLALRASSEGSLGWPVLLAGSLLLALALWPLAARTTSIPTLTGVLAVAQFGTHALAVLAAGQAAGPRSLVCCASTSQVRGGVLGELTAQAGWALAGAQLLVFLLLAISIRGGRAVADLLESVAGLVHALVDPVCCHLVALLALALRLAPAPVAPPAPRPTPARVLDAGRVLARRTVRRGPPATAFSPAPSRAAMAPLALPAAG